MNLTVQKKYIVLAAAIPVLVALFFIASAFILGNPGFKVDKTQFGLRVSEVIEELNPVQSGDLIVTVNGLSYGQVLGYLFVQPEQSKQNTVIIARDGKLLPFTLRSTPHTLSSLLVLIWPHLIFITLFIFIGMTALLRAQPGKITTLFFLMLCGFSCSIAFTLASNMGMLAPPVMSASFVGLAIFNWFSFGAWAHFTCCFPRERDITSRRPWLPLLFYFLPPIVAVILSLTIAGVTPEFWGWVQRLRNVFLPLIICGTFVKHIIDFLQLSGKSARNQIKYPLAAYWLSFGPYLFLYLLPNLLFDHPLIYFRTAILAFLIMPMAYLFALIRYRLFEVDKMISRIMAYIILITTVTILYSLFLVTIKRWLWGKGVLTEELFLVFMVVVIASFNPSVNWIQKTINRYIFRNIAVSPSILSNLSRKISTALQISDLARIVTNDLPEQFALNKVALVVIDDKHVNAYPEQSVRSLPDLTDRQQLIDQFSDHDEVLLSRLVHDDDQNTAEIKHLRSNGWAIVLRLQGSSNLMGLLFIGAKTNGHVFNVDDIHILTTLANHAGIALENGLRYERLAQSKKQQEKTFKKLMHSEKMAAIGEMTTTLAHELKNPLAVIRSSAQYVVEGKQSSTVSQEMLGYIIDEVDALNLTVSSLLGLARHRVPDLKPVNVHEEIPAILRRWKQSDDHIPGIKIICEIKEQLPELHCDINQISQIILNLIRNAEEAMGQPGEIKVEVSNMDNNALISIADTGPGLGRGNLNQVFENFFTTKVSGMGLGLPVCRQLVHSHHGSINIKNGKNGGAEALFLLPFEPYKELVGIESLVTVPSLT